MTILKGTGTVRTKWAGSVVHYAFCKVQVHTLHNILNYWLMIFVIWLCHLSTSACQKLTTSKSSRPTTPNHYTPRGGPSYNPAAGYVMASPNASTGNGYPGSAIIGAPPSPGFQHSPHHASIPSSYHKVSRDTRLAFSVPVITIF